MDTKSLHGLIRWMWSLWRHAVAAAVYWDNDFEFGVMESSECRNGKDLKLQRECGDLRGYATGRRLVVFCAVRRGLFCADFARRNQSDGPRLHDDRLQGQEADAVDLYLCRFARKT